MVSYTNECAHTNLLQALKEKTQRRKDFAAPVPHPYLHSLHGMNKCQLFEAFV